MDESEIYWIEIECRNDHDGMRSPSLASIPQSRANIIIGDMLLKIAESEGRNLPAIARNAVSDQPAPAHSAVFKQSYTDRKVARQVENKPGSGNEPSPSDSSSALRHRVEAGSSPKSVESTNTVVEGLKVDAVKRVLRLAAGTANTQT